MPVLSSTRASIATFVAIGFLLTSNASSAPPKAIDRFLSAGEFGPAIRAAQKEPAERRDAALAKIAAAQRAAGAQGASLSTLGLMQGSGARLKAAEDLRASRPVGESMGAGGGAAMADFDTLMTLIQETIAPETWEENGGSGRMSPFPLGVHVDADGVLKRTAPVVAGGSLVAARAAALRAQSSSDARTPSSLRKVSLVRLERELQKCWAAGESPDEAMRHLAGLRRVQYVFVYPESQDIVIAGPAGDWAFDDGRAVSADSVGKAVPTPVLNLDDWLVVLRNSYHGGKFTCTIEPTSEGIAAAQAFQLESSKKPLREGKAAREKWMNGLRTALGKQNIKVGGIDPRTNVARTIVEADYHMKRIGMGLESAVPGVTSYLDSIEIKPGEAPPAMDVLRWWFTLAEAPPSTTESRDAFELAKSSVQVLSENEFVERTGEIVYTGKSSERNLRFSQSFTRHFDALAAKYRVYGELRNVFDLAMVAAIMKHHDLPNQVGWRPTLMLDEQRFPVALGPAPAKVDSICNSRLVNGKHVIAGVSGGVEFEPQKLLGDKLKIDDYGALKAGHEESKPKQIEDDRWFWD